MKAKVLRIVLVLFLSSIFNNLYSQMVRTYAGNGIDSLVNGNAKSASFGKCFGICSDKEGNIYVPDTDHHCIRKIDTKGNVTTFAGTGKAGNKDGIALEATFTEPSGAFADQNGNLFIADWGGNKIRKIDKDGIVSTIAGLDSTGYINGSFKEAMFCAPRGVCVDMNGIIYVGDCWNHSIRKISPEGEVSNIAGGGQPYIYFNKGSFKDDKGLEARFDAPCGVYTDKNGNVYAADANNNRIRKITSDGIVSTIAGNTGIGGYKDGHIDTAMLYVPTELVIDDEGYIFIGDSYNNCVRMLTPDGFLYTIAGNGEKGYMDGINSVCDSPRGVTLIGEDVYFFDYYNYRVRVIENPKSILKN